jgi:Protein of unknown function (DUF3105)
MVDETRETKREKRDAARRARIEEQRRRQRARRRKRFLIGGLAGVLAAVLVAFTVVKVGQNRANSAAALKAAAKAAGCDEVTEYPDAGHQHIDNVTPDKRVPYTSTPPTSGDHYSAQPPDPSFYTEPTMRPERYVHALEHGQVIIHYNDIPQDQIDELEKIQAEHPRSTVVMKNPEIKAPVAITAWRYMQQCQKVSKPVIERFIDTRCNKGPEKLTPDC